MGSTQKFVERCQDHQLTRSEELGVFDTLDQNDVTDSNVTPKASARDLGSLLVWTCEKISHRSNWIIHLSNNYNTYKHHLNKSRLVINYRNVLLQFKYLIHTSNVSGV